MQDKNFILCRNCPRKLLIPLIGQFHFMTEPTKFVGHKMRVLSVIKLNLRVGFHRV